MKRNIEIIHDIAGNKIVVVNDIRFKGKRKINWNDVREYLKEFVDEFYTIADTKDIIYIGKDLPDEYTGSKYTRSMMGGIAKAKAYIAQGIPELIQVATNRRFKENLEDKHNMNAKFGWYRYDSRFAIPVYDEMGEIERYNIFRAEMVIRHDANGKLYLYDVINAKKETSNPLCLMRTVKNPFPKYIL